MSFDTNREPNPQLQQNIIFDKTQKKEIRNSDLIIRQNEYVKYSFYDGRTILSINGTKYNDSAIYVWKGKIHNIQSVFYDGELIVESFNGNQKVFFCFLLKHSYGNPETFIDKMCSENGDNITYDIGSLIGEGDKAIFYKDGINSVIVYLTPITIKTAIKTNSNSFPKCYIMPNFSSDYNIVTVKFSLTANDSVKTLQESMFSYLEGFTQHKNNLITVDALGNTLIDIGDNSTGITQTALIENGLYLDCAPTSQSTETISSITLPLDKNGNVNLSNSLLFSSIMNSLILFILIAFVFLTLPTFYKFTIVDVIAKNNVPDKGTRLKTVCYLAFITISIFCISLIYDGTSKGKNMYQAYAGIFFGLTLLISVGRLYFLKNNNDYNFQQLYNWSPYDIFVFFKETYNYILDNLNGISMVYIACTIGIIVPFLASIYFRDKFVPVSDTKTHATTVLLGYAFAYNLIIAPFAYLVGTTYSVKSTN